MPTPNLWQDLLEVVSRAFDQAIHLDWFKHLLFSDPAMQASYPSLSQLGTLAEKSTQFHACERRWKCDEVWGSGLGCYHIEEEDQHKLYGPKRKTRVAMEPTDVSELKGKERERQGVAKEYIVSVNPNRMSEDKSARYFEWVHNRIDGIKEYEKNDTGSIYVPGFTNDPSKPRKEYPNNLVRSSSSSSPFTCLIWRDF